MDHRLGMALTATAVMACVGATAGCGGADQSYTNRPRPPAVMLITGSVSTHSVSISPQRFGAGPIDLLVTNQTGAAQRITLESDAGAGAGAGLKQETAPINPRDTARLSATVTPGRYRVQVSGADIRAARITVGKERPSSQNDLLEP